jgi:4-hydroxy-tetrahydrodipicolinate synthase
MVLSRMIYKPKIDLKGVILPMLTPFKTNEELDEGALRRYTRWLIENGVHGLFPNSSMGEFPKLSVEERKRVMDIVVDEANGKVPVLPGTGDVSTRTTMSLTKHAKDAGADAAIIVTPYYCHPSEDALYNHYKSISDELDFPIAVYDIPEATGYSVRPELVARLAEIKNVVAIKDSSCDMTKFIRELQLVGGKVAVLQGSEYLFVPSLIMGAPGGILGIASACPSFTVQIYETFVKGNVKKAVEMQMKLVRLLDQFAEYDFITAVMQAVRIRGISLGNVRRPGSLATKEQETKVRETLSKFDKNAL